jgi:outer membrane lipase/esterase
MTHSTASTGLLACASILALSLAQPAQADNLLAFGDSLSDTGNAFALTGGAFPDPRFYHEGRLSDGPVWVDRLAGEHGLLANLMTGAEGEADADWNFAVAGATSGAEPLDPAAGTPPGVRAQVDAARAMAEAGRIRLDGGTTAMLWGGANDYGMWLTSAGRDPAADGAVTAGVVGNLDAATRGLTEAGAGRVAVLNLFDFSLAPTTALLPGAVREAGDAMTAEHNRLLLAAAEQADADSDAQVVLVDVDAVFDAVAADPAAWGFETLAPCLPACEEPGSADGHVFWDGTHLTSAAHALVAETVGGTLSAASELPQLTGETTALAFQLADEHRRRQEAAALGAGDGFGFVVGAITSGVQAGRQTGRVNGAAVGATWGAGALTYGALASWQTGSVAGGESEIDADAWSGSVALRYASGPLSVTGQLGYSRADFDITRDTAFAPDPRALGEVTAGTRYADVELGYALASTGALEIGLSGGLTWASTRRDAWDETGAGLMGASVEEQTRETLTARVGLDAAATTDLGGLAVTGFGSLRYMEVLRDSTEGGAVFLASGQDFGAMGFDEDSGLEVELGASTRLTESLEITASYRARPEDGWDDGVLSAALVGRF